MPGKKGVKKKLPVQRRPGFITFVAVAFIVFGALSIIGSIFLGALGLFGDDLASLIQEENSAQNLSIQEQQKLTEFTDTIIPILIPLAIGIFVLSIIDIIVGIYLLKGRRGAWITGIILLGLHALYGVILLLAGFSFGTLLWVIAEVILLVYLATDRRIRAYFSQQRK